MITQKDQIKNKLGPKLFQSVYEFLWFHRSQTNLDEGMMHEELKEMVNGNKFLMNAIF